MSSIYVAATMISGKRKHTGIECAVSDCTLRNSDGVSLYTFPKDMRFRRQWVNFVRTNRANFIPSTYSRICSMHFASDCYPATYAIQESLGFTVKRKLLLPTAVPTIQKHEFSKPTPRKLNDEILRMNGNSVIPGISLPLPFAMASFTHTPDTSVNALLTGGLNTASYCATAPHEGVMKTVATAIQGAHTIRQLLSKTERKAEKSLELSIEQRNRTNNPSFPVKNNGSVRRKKLKLLPMVPEREDDIPKISCQTIKVEENSDDTTSLISCEQGNQQYMVVAMDDLLKPYTVIHPAGSSTNCPGPPNLQKKGNNTSVRKQLQTWTTTGNRHSAEFHCTIEVKQEASSDQEEGTECTDQLEDGAVKKEAATDHLSPHCQRTSKRKRKSSSKAVLQQPSCEVQSSSTQEDSRCSKTDIQDHHINMINPAFIKKEPEDFETKAEPVAQIGCQSSKIKTKPRSEELPLLNMLHSDSVKKEPQDFEALWNVEMVTPTTNQSVKTKTETEIYPTGIYHNVHFAKLRSRVFTSDSAKEVSCAGDDSKCS